jgi:aryl-alcohol dehydrogenase-like predicted oxidoreductase
LTAADGVYHNKGIDHSPSAAAGAVANSNERKETRMQYRLFPKTRLSVPLISLGTMMFGAQTNEQDSLAIMDYAFEHGVNFFDTANMYNAGESERIVGKALKGRRDKIVLATKAGLAMGEGTNDSGLSRRHLIHALNASLKRLDTDYVDIYYLHAPDYDTAIEETLETMDAFVRSGKVRYIGVSNYAAWQISDILAACDKHSLVSPIVTQNVYNPITRGIEGELVPFLRAHSLGLAIYNPIAGGLLAGKHRPGTPTQHTRFADNKIYYDRYWSQENFTAVEKLTDIASAHGMSILELAMKWCAAQPCVTTIISGVSRLSQLEQNIRAVEGEPLSADILARCDDVYRALAGTRFQYNR